MNTFSSSSSKKQHAHFHINTPVFFEEMKKPYFAKFCIISYFLSVLFLFSVVSCCSPRNINLWSSFIKHGIIIFHHLAQVCLFYARAKKILRLNFHFLLLANGLLMFLAARTQQKVLFKKKREEIMMPEKC